MLVNSNAATVMTAPGMADAMERGEDRLAFKETMKNRGIDLPARERAYTVEEVEAIAPKLGTQRRAVGEAKSIGTNDKEAFQKAIRSLEIGRHGLGFAKDLNKKTLPELMAPLCQPISERQFIIHEALRKGALVGELCRLIYIQPYFIRQMKELVELEEQSSITRANCCRTSCLSKRNRTGSPTSTSPSCSTCQKESFVSNARNSSRRRLPHRVHAQGTRVRDHHGQLQPRDRLDRLRHVRQTLLCAGTVLITTIEKNKQLVEITHGFAKLGFNIVATEGRQMFLAEHGITTTRINKQHEGRPHIPDAITNKEMQVVVNTPAGKRSRTDDSSIRKTAIKHRVPHMSTLAAARASVRGIAAERAVHAGVKALQAYHASMG